MASSFVADFGDRLALDPDGTEDMRRMLEASEAWERSGPPGLENLLGEADHAIHFARLQQQVPPGQAHPIRTLIAWHLRDGGGGTDRSLEVARDALRIARAAAEFASADVDGAAPTRVPAAGLPTGPGRDQRPHRGAGAPRTATVAATRVPASRRPDPSAAAGEAVSPVAPAPGSVDLDSAGVAGAVGAGSSRRAAEPSPALPGSRIAGVRRPAPVDTPRPGGAGPFKRQRTGSWSAAQHAAQRRAEFDRMLAEQMALEEPGAAEPGPLPPGVVSWRPSSGMVEAHGMRLRLSDVEPDGDRFFTSVLSMLDPDFRSSIGVPDPFGPRPDATRRAVQALRNWLAARIQEDFGVAERGLPARYASGFRYTTGAGAPMPRAQRNAWLRDIRRPGHWASQTGDLIVNALAMELNLPFLVVEPRGTQHIGPAAEPGSGWLPIVRVDQNHYLAALAETGMEHDVRWQGRQPAGFSSVPEARERLARMEADVQARWAAALADADRMTSTLPDERVAELIERTDVARATWRSTWDDEYEDVPAYRRAQHRIDELARVARQLEDAAEHLPDAASDDEGGAEPRASDAGDPVDHRPAPGAAAAGR